MTEREVYDRIQLDLELIAQHRQMYELRQLDGTTVKDDLYAALARQFKYSCVIAVRYCPKDCRTGPYLHPLRLLTQHSGVIKSKVYLEREWKWSTTQINKASPVNAIKKDRRGTYDRKAAAEKRAALAKREMKRGRGRPKWTPGIKDEPKKVKGIV